MSGDSLARDNSQNLGRIGEVGLNAEIRLADKRVFQQSVSGTGVNDFTRLENIGAIGRREGHGRILLNDEDSDAVDNYLSV